MLFGISEKSLKKASLLNPKGLSAGGSVDKILFSSARSWGGIEDDHKPFMHARPGKLHVYYYGSEQEVNTEVIHIIRLIQALLNLRNLYFHFF